VDWGSHRPHSQQEADRQRGAAVARSIQNIPVPRASQPALPAEPATPQCSPSMSRRPCPTGDSHLCPLPGSREATGAIVTRGRGPGCCCAWWEARGRGEERLGELGGLGCAEPGVWAGQEPTKTLQGVLCFCLSIFCSYCSLQGGCLELSDIQPIGASPRGRMVGDFS